MAGEGFEVEEWDADFLDQLVQAEEFALTSSATQTHQPPPPPPPPPPPSFATLLDRNDDISYSPPRELSQRVPDPPPPPPFGSSLRVPTASLFDDTHDDRELEIGRLKKELGRVSKQLTLLEEECIELKKESRKKEEQLKSVSLEIEAKGPVACHTNSKNSHYTNGLHGDRGILEEFQQGNFVNELLKPKVELCQKACKEVGVQTDKAGESENSSFKNDSCVSSHIQKQFLGIWNPFNGPNLGRVLVSKLLATCEVDIKVLFGHINLSLPPDKKIVMDSLCEYKVPSEDPSQPSEAAKILHFYSTLAKISNEMARFEDLLKALFSLCQLENGVILFHSLRVLREVLKHVFSTQIKFTRRDNVMVTGPSPGGRPPDLCGSTSIDNESLLFRLKLDQNHFRQRADSLNLERKPFMPCQNTSLSRFDWISMFVLMCEIVTENFHKSVNLEAVSIMNIITLSCNPYSERDKFASAMVFRVISQILKKEAGIPVRKHGVNLLYQLLNCPKVTAVFCSGYQEGGENSVPTEVDAKIKSTFEEFGVIMEGLADCVTCSEHSIDELELRKSALTLLAFLASLGRTGLAIMLNHRLQKRSSILACILQDLISDLDLDSSCSTPTFDVFKERTKLLREALILLNRMVSHPQYSVAVLRVLTSSREVCSLTIDIANRLSRKNKCMWQDDSTTRQIRESEIPELARVFKRRVYSFLGDTIS